MTTFIRLRGLSRTHFFTAFDLGGHTLWTKQLNNETLLIECGGPATLSVGSTGIYVADNTCLRTPSTGVVYVSFIRKYDFGGNELWTRWSRTVGGTSGVWNQTLGISADSKGAYTVGPDFVQHLDPGGNKVWTLQIEMQFYRSISVSSRGIFVAGGTSIDKLCDSPSCIHN